MIQARKRAKFKSFIFPLLIFVSTLIMGVGYAAVSDVPLTIEGSVMAISYHDIFISDFTLVQNSDSEVVNSSYLEKIYGTRFNAKVFLEDNLDSSVTFKLTLCNATKSVYTYMGVQYDPFVYNNTDIEVTVEGLEVGDKFLGKSYIDIYLTFSYVDGLEQINSTLLDGYLYLVFDKLPPEFSVLGNPVNWVNTDATLEVVPSDDVPVDFFEYSFDGGENWSTSNKMTYPENTDNINILIRDYDGFVSNVYTTAVTKIDKVNPTIYVDPSIYNDLIITLGDSYTIKDFISVSDDASDINYNSYKVTRNDGTILSNTADFVAPGYYNMVVYVEDIAGNSSTLDWKILVRWPTGARYVLARQDVVSSGYGLYADTPETGLDPNLPFTSNYYYAGATVNNYINFSNFTFQIISLSQNNTIKLIGDSAGRYRYVPNAFVLTNKFFSSNNTIRKNLISWGQSGSFGDMTIDLSHVEDGIFYIGAIDKNERNTLAEQISDERTNNDRLEGNSAAWSNKLGLCTATEWAKSAGQIKIIEDLGKFVSSTWLYFGFSEWTITANSGTNNAYWRLSDSSSSIESSGAYANESRVRPTFFLKGDTIISGTGTDVDPFVVQENWEWFDIPAKQNLL